MALEIIIGERKAKIELLSQIGNMIRVNVDGKIYDLDLMMVEQGVYSILYNNISYNVELIEKEDYHRYTVNTLYNSWDVEIIDSEIKYRRNRHPEDNDDVKKIFSPMPGKVVKILVNEGEEVKAGETVIIVSAMKMESEYKVKKDRIVKKVLVKEGDTIDGNQTLIVLE
ncbi:MAG: biotin/lipoyl-binding protein [Sphingobacteriia bacterium]|nr:biotin/lipoyl-binding protein [Sphingobacteriia bacterium]